MVEVKYQTLGEAFIEDLTLAKKSKNTLFEFLVKTIQRDNPKKEIADVINEVTESESLINYYDVLSRLQIERNSKTINNIRKRLKGIKSLQQGKDSGYAKIMQKKLNVLSAMTIGLKEHLYMIINCYVREMSYGDVKDFKEEFLQYVGNRQYAAGSGLYDTEKEKRPASYM